MPEVEAEIMVIIREFLILIQKKMRIWKTFLYGSYAKGIAGKWSDIDIAIISPDFSKDLFEERVRLMQLALCIDERIEPRPFRPEDFNENDPLVNEIRKSGIEIMLD